MLGRKEPAFVRRLGDIWNSVTHIKDLATFRKHSEECTLMAFDLEGYVASVNEIGLATLSTSPEKPLVTPKAGEALQIFYEKNDVRAHRITVWEERWKKHHEPFNFGDHITVKKDEIRETLHTMLSNLNKESNDLILVVYSAYAEFEWLSRECPSFLSRFRYWVDAQELVEECCGQRPSLLKTLVAMQIPDRDPYEGYIRSHRASNDAVRTLAVLVTAAATGNFEYSPVQVTKFLGRSMPKSWDRYPYRVRITTKERSILPTQLNTSRKLATYFAEYNPTAVQVNTSKSRRARGVRVCWVCVPDIESLDAIAAAVKTSVLEGREFIVEKHMAPQRPFYHDGDALKRELRTNGDADQYLEAASWDDASLEGLFASLE